MAKPTTSADVLAEFIKIDQKYRTGGTKKMDEAIQNVTLQEIDSVLKTTEQITVMAKDSLNDYYINGKAKIIENFNKLIIKCQNDAFDRGLLNSSIIVNKTIELENQKADRLLIFESQYQQKLAAKILELSIKEEKRMADIIKYNNDCALKQANYSVTLGKAYGIEDSNRLKRQLDLFKFEMVYGSLSVSKIVNEEKYSVACEYLYTLTAALSFYEVSNVAFYKQHLSAGYYDKLNAEMWQRLNG